MARWDLHDELLQLIGSLKLLPASRCVTLDISYIALGHVPEPSLSLQVLGYRLQLLGLVVQLEVLTVKNLEEWPDTALDASPAKLHGLGWARALNRN